MIKGLIGILVSLILVGCSLIEMKHENEMIQGRIDTKEGQLEELQREAQRLEEEQRRLADELGTRRLTLNQLNQELEILISQNRQFEAMGKRQHQKMDQVEAEIANLELKKNELVQIEAQSIASSAKEEKIAQLQEEIRNYLILGLKSKHRQNLQ
jgi:predicted nuclease with TOPRIM domain